MTRRGLGRGLDVLIPAEDAGTGLHQVPIAAIVPNPHQPRTRLSDSGLAELAASIQEHGIIQPLIVTRGAEGKYQLIAGERRWRAAKLAGLTDVPVVVKDVAPQEMLELALVENIQRADLNPLEEALAYRQLVEEFGLSQSEIARRVGKSRSAVNNVMRLLSAAEAVRKALMDERITEGHGRALLGLESQEAQEEALRIVLDKKLTVRETEALVRKMRSRAEKVSSSSDTDAEEPLIRALESRFREALGTRVRLKHSKHRGQIIIYYYSDEEFQSLYQQLTGEEL